MGNAERRPGDETEAARSRTAAFNDNRASCPDCFSSQIGPRVFHDATCPMLHAIEQVPDEDIRWFADHPHAMSRVRKITHVERFMIECAGGTALPDVSVTRHANGDLRWEYRAVFRDAKGRRYTEPLLGVSRGGAR